MQVIKSKIDESVLGIILKIDDYCNPVKFYGSKLDFLQVATFNWDKNKVVKNHRHINRPRLATRTQEAIIVMSGSCELRVFDFDDILIFKDVLLEQNVFISYSGGLGFTCLEPDTKILEMKNGPYNVKTDDEDRILLED